MTETRDWYRHKRTGDRAYRQDVDGVDSIILDRPAHPIVKRFREGEWVTDKDSRPLNEMALAQLAFAADAVLCKQLGHHNKDDLWINLRDSQRIAWMRKGPTKSFPRKTLYEYLMWAVQYLSVSGEDPPPSALSLKEAVRLIREEAEKPGRKTKFAKELIALMVEDDAQEGDKAAE